MRAARGSEAEARELIEHYESELYPQYEAVANARNGKKGKPDEDKYAEVKNLVARVQVLI